MPHIVVYSTFHYCSFNLFLIMRNICRHLTDVWRCFRLVFVPVFSESTLYVNIYAYIMLQLC